MNCIVWNARGLGGARAFHELRRLLADYSPLIIFICETKLLVSRCSWWRSFFGYTGIFGVDARGKSGGLLLLWKAPADITIRSFTPGHIDCFVKIEEISWRFTGFYGNPDSQLRRHSWDLLRRLHIDAQHRQEAWLVGGDFNEVLWQREKYGGRYRSLNQIEAFRQVVEECELRDIFEDEAGFTWSNNRASDEVIKARLDRFLMNQNWLTLFPVSKLTTLDQYGSDHRALLLTFERTRQQKTYKGRKRFHFEQKWFMEQGFVEEFLMKWLSVPNLHSLPSRLEMSQHFLTAWAGNRFNRLGKKLKEMRAERVRWLNKEHNAEQEKEVARLSAEIEKITEMEEVHWKQRSRTNWLGLGDRNTTYFHLHASERRRKNHIQGLYDALGQWHTDEREVVDIIESYFKELFMSTGPTTHDIDAVLKHNLPTLPDEVAENLSLPFTAEEVRRALFQMHPTKAPGPDGFSPIFFQKLWPAIGRSITVDVLKILNGEDNISEWNNTNIVLVPKVKKPTRMQDFRPISLCNTIYKIVTKAIVNRLRPALTHVVDPMQSAFIKGRLISDNIIVGFEAMHWLRQRKRGSAGYAIAKLDMSKAYDRVEWNYLRAILTNMKFPSRLVDLIMMCVSTAKFSFVVNGLVYSNITHARGLRQGDPLSPFLFVLCAQGLSSMFVDLEKRKLFKGIRIAQSAPTLSHLFFADDSLLFFKVEDQGVRNIQTALQTYSKASGQLINFDKSAAVFSPSTTRRKIEVVRAILGVKEVQEHAIYLGLPTCSARKKRVQFDFLRERVGRKILSWKSKYFSAGGKEVLIKSILQAIPIYTMSCFKIPVGICLEIEKLCQNFWWGDSNSHKIHWAKWNDLCRPKSDGGLGFRRLEVFNQALLAKQVWRIILNPESLVTKILKARYFRQMDIMDVKVSSKSSFIWRSLCWGRELLRSGLRWRVHNGKSIRIYRDAWIPSFTSGKPLLIRNNETDLRVSDLLLNDHKWDRELLENLFLPVEVEAISAITPGSPTRDDDRYWKFTEDGMFSVKSGYLVGLGFSQTAANQSSPAKDNWWIILWKLRLPPKVKIFAWRVTRGFIPVDEVLRCRHVPLSGICSWCRRGQGTISHCLLFCELVKGVWKHSMFWDFLRLFKLHPIDEICRKMFSEMRHDYLERWFMALWEIWNNLCKIKHDNQDGIHARVIETSEFYLDSYKGARRHLQISCKLFPEVGSEKWKLPPRGKFRLDVDVSIKSNLRIMGVGAVLRNHQGELVAALVGPAPCMTTVLMGELYDALLGLRMCVDLNLAQIQVFSDSILAVRVLTNSDGQPSILCNDILEAISSAKFGRVESFNHMKREANRVAHELANYAFSLNDITVWKSCFPEWLINCVHEDLNH